MLWTSPRSQYSNVAIQYSTRHEYFSLLEEKKTGGKGLMSDGDGLFGSLISTGSFKQVEIPGLMVVFKTDARKTPKKD